MTNRVGLNLIGVIPLGNIARPIMALRKSALPARLPTTAMDIGSSRLFSRVFNVLSRAFGECVRHSV